jgi:hypothetical protein
VLVIKGTATTVSPQQEALIASQAGIGSGYLRTLNAIYEAHSSATKRRGVFQTGVIKMFPHYDVVGGADSGTNMMWCRSLWDFLTELHTPNFLFNLFSRYFLDNHLFN